MLWTLNPSSWTLSPSSRPPCIKTNGSSKTEYEIALPSLLVFERVGHPPGTIFGYSWGVRADRGCNPFADPVGKIDKVQKPQTPRLMPSSTPSAANSVAAPAKYQICPMMNIPPCFPPSDARSHHGKPMKGKNVWSRPSHIKR